MESTPHPTIPSPTDSASAPPPTADATLGLATISSLLDRLDQPLAADDDPRRTNPIGAASQVALGYQNQLIQARLGMASSLFVALRAKHARNRVSLPARGTWLFFLGPPPGFAGTSA